MDGENTSLYSDGYVHARSIDSSNHESRNWVKRFWAERSFSLPEGWRVCGENLYAKHAIAYDALPSYLMAFSMFDENQRRLDWDDFIEWSGEIGISTVPVLHRMCAVDGWLDVAEKIFNQVVADGKEGIVITTAEGFAYDDHSIHLAKAVRKNHVQPDSKHWMSQKVIPNKLLSDK